MNIMEVTFCNETKVKFFVTNDYRSSTQQQSGRVDPLLRQGYNTIQCVSTNKYITHNNADSVLEMRGQDDDYLNKIIVDVHFRVSG